MCKYKIILGNIQYFRENRYTHLVLYNWVYNKVVIKLFKTIEISEYTLIAMPRKKSFFFILYFIVNSIWISKEKNAKYIANVRLISLLNVEEKYFFCEGQYASYDGLNAR